MGKSDHNHVTPAGYLRRWAVDGLIAMRLVGKTGSKVVSVRNAGVRSGFYLERNADGVTSDRFEKKLSLAEHKLLPFVAHVDTLWPFSAEQRCGVAEYVALQFVRTPAWRFFHGQALGTARASLAAKRLAGPDVILTSAEEHLQTDKERHETMTQQRLLIASMLANMHWTLLACGQPRLATSDHPVVSLTVGGDALWTSSAPERGLHNTSEIRIAMSPRHLLVATWSDELDGQPKRKATIRQVRNHNSLVIQQAEKQWFHHPHHAIEHPAGPWYPIAHDLFPGYDPVRSSRRHHVERVVSTLVEQGPEAPRGIILADWERTAVLRTT